MSAHADAPGPWPRAAAERFRPPDPRALRWAPQLRGRNGRGVAVALVDTGLDWTLPAFRGASLDYVDLLGTGAAADPSGHGTRGAALLLCPALAAGAPGLGEPGLGEPGRGKLNREAPALAGAVSLTVFKAVGGGPGAVARALRLALARGARLVVLPFGRLLPDREVARAVAALLAAGTEVLAAAGNRGPEQVLFPASMPGVLAVSGAGLDGAVLAECPDGAAVSCLAPGLVRCPADGRTMRGSSAAAVMAAGLRALALQA